MDNRGLFYGFMRYTECMKYLSTFSGIGGFELGIQQAYENSVIQTSEKTGGQDIRPSGDSPSSPEFVWDGGRTSPTCIGFSEIDKYATEIYQRHFPNHKNYGDITKINEKELPDFDLLVGGFPCQAFSIAGKRGGFEDTRGTMFFELARILREKQPRLFVFENVKGLLSHDKGATFRTIITTLDELGYDCQWQVLNSKNHGVPQNRERVFIIGHLRGTPRPEVFPFGGTDEATDGHRSIPKVIARGGLQNHAGEMVERSPALTEAMGKGGGQTPIIKQLNQPNHSNDRVYGTDGVSPTLNTMQGGNRQPFIRETKDGFHAYRNDKKKSSIQGTHVTYPKGKAHAMSTAHKPMTLENSQIRRLTPTECERLQGFPDGWTEGLSDTQRYKTLGNAVTVNVIKDIFEQILWG